MPIASASAAAPPARPPGSHKLIRKFEEEAAQKQVKLEIVKTGCQGFCQRGPLVIQDPQEIFYQKVKVHDVSGLFSDSVIRGIPYRKQLYREFPMSDPNVAMKDIPFYKKQRRVALHRNGVVDPCNIYDAIREDGYAGLAKVITDMKPDEVIELVKKSGSAARRRGLPCRAQVGAHQKIGRQNQGRRLQRRRGRSGRVHGPLGHGRRPPLRARGHAHQCLCHRRAIRLYLRAA